MIGAYTFRLKIISTEMDSWDNCLQCFFEHIALDYLRDYEDIGKKKWRDTSNGKII